ncbi:DUF1599 domain-containing protein [Parafilimonas sp.]|uniref:DUF1599 domain-containing protein n=1 Tax=Parafilimonas sp. TaxID=1969739 RepID=UPI0039E52E53
MTNTESQFDKVIERCKEIFLKKTKDYGTAWRVLRIISVVDQIFIKALRIRNIQGLAARKVEDDVQSEFAGIINYAVIGLIQLKLNDPVVEELSVKQASDLYDEAVHTARHTLLNKNHDYSEAWREMSQESYVDLILMKLLRVRQILNNDGKTLISEGIDANYVDIINYAVFALIMIDEGKHKS